MVGVDGVHVDIEILLRFENIEEDGKLEPVPKGQLTKVGSWSSSYELRRRLARNSLGCISGTVLPGFGLTPGFFVN